MSVLDNGISRYIHAVAKVHVWFPVDRNGNELIRCEQCRFYSDTGKRCRLNNEVCAFPSKYVGSDCPLEIVEEDEEGEIEDGPFI